MKQLEEIIQGYLNSIVYLSDRKMPINSTTIHYLTERAQSAFYHELGGKQISLQVESGTRSVTLTLTN